MTGDETWVYIFEHQREMNNKIWAIRNARRPVTAKRTLIVKKVMLAVFFSTSTGLGFKFLFLRGEQ